MPSLRRTFSNPIPRSSPYTSGGTTARGSGHRRSSGSETTNRRVLADIEWWRVTDGQCDALADQESEDPNRGISDLLPLEVVLGSGITVTHIDDGVEHLSPLPTPWTPELVEDLLEPSVAPPTEQFSVMSITPHTPTHRHLSLDSPASSVESTPEPTTPLQGLGLRVPVMDLDFFEADFHPVQHRYSRCGSLSPLSFPALKFDDDSSMKEDIFSDQGDYANFTTSPLSCAPAFLD